MKEIREHRGYIDIREQLHSSKEDAIVASLEALFEEILGIRVHIPIKRAPLEKNMEQLLYLLQEYSREATSGN